MQGELKSNHKAGQKRRRKGNYYFHFPSYRLPGKTKRNMPYLFKQRFTYKKYGIWVFRNFLPSICQRLIMKIYI